MKRYEDICFENDYLFYKLRTLKHWVFRPLHMMAYTLRLEPYWRVTGLFYSFIGFDWESLHFDAFDVKVVVSSGDKLD